MNLWRRLVLPIYYYGTWPIRLGYGRLSSCRGRCPIVVVVFHRVADDQATPWTCPTDVFRRQIDWLRRRFELISLAEVQRRLREKNSRRPAVHITFDDGYADNTRFVLPWLLEQNIPCTYFVSVEHVRTGKPFGHDLALGRPLAPHRPEELRQLAEAGLEIGCHSYSHQDLGPVTDPEVLEKEIVHARWELEDLLNRPVRYFAFPFGHPKNLNREGFRWAHWAGYEAACSAYGVYNLPGRDPFHIRRIPADSWLLRLKNHVLFDPRKFFDPLADWALEPTTSAPPVPLDLPQPAPPLQPPAPAIGEAKLSEPIIPLELLERGYSTPTLSGVPDAEPLTPLELCERRIGDAALPEPTPSPKPSEPAVKETKLPERVTR